MTDEPRSLREHLADPKLYAGAPPAASTHPVAWRAALLARYPDPRRRRPRSVAPEWRRLVLFVALPLAAATTVALLATAGVDLTPRLELPRPSADGLLAAIRQAPHVVWYGLAGCSTLFTLLVRGRALRLLPVDW